MTVTAGDGTTVLYSAQTGTAVAGEIGQYTWVLPAQTQCDQLTATWTSVVGGVAYLTPVEVNVVGQRLIEPWQLRKDYSKLSALDTEDLLELLEQAEDLFTDVLGFPPALEGARVEWDVLRGTINDALYIAGTVNGLPYGWGAGKMLVPEVRKPWQVYAGSINGVALDPTADVPMIKVEQGALVWADYRPWISGRYTLWVAHGDPVPPRDLRRACGKYVNHLASTSTYPDRASQVVTEGATINFALPTPDRPTGIPEIDAVLVRYRLDSVV
ncbi:hypothetical protein K6U06_06595 [Acidiferrimicrobium sp. IK]|uniref:hypothetical protein n=1 Tax=Acidiferrimicrobium sp. IK TaxID=2871700 RepID=UPI0021CAF929|nr:hypothetical protein [Acidiferrimicrobium sp. IK]MCU4184022.1 hypothetical protein [Acidiferrimicrobium sp. IK]